MTTPDRRPRGSIHRPSRRSRSSRAATRLRTALGLALTVVLAAFVAANTGSSPAVGASYTAIAGGGSSWAGQAWADFTSNAKNQGVSVTYTPNGSSMGRNMFASENSFSFADSEIPFTGDASDEQDRTTPRFAWGMLPIVAGGTAFMYNLPVGGNRYSDLKLSMDNIAGIFSGRISNWSDPAIAANNPGVSLPNHQIIVVVRSDGSGATAQFKLWMLRQFPDDYARLAAATGGDASHASSYYPTGDYGSCSDPAKPCFTAQNGSAGVTSFTKSNDYTINYDEYAYALGVGFPVAQIKNAAGYYTLPSASAVAVALLKTKINTDQADPNYLSQDLSDVYGYGDPRAYPMSMYSYEVIPKETNQVTSADRGATLAWISRNAVCEWQRDMGALGYSPLPMNLVLASLEQIAQIPGIDSDTSAAITATQQGVLHGGTDPCNNPTFKAGDDPAHNVLVDSAPFPAGCDAACQAPWRTASTSTSGPKQTTGGSGGSGTSGGSSSTGGSGASAVNAAAQVCDPDTGICTSTTADGTTTAAGTSIKAVPATLAGDAGWASNAVLGVIAAVLVLTVLLVPPVIDRAARRRERAR